MAEVVLLLGVFGVTFTAGVWFILKVPPRLHTPLMSMTNAVSGVTVLGALLLLASDTAWWHTVVGALACGAGAFNLVGGFVVTDRMLRMFRSRGESHD